MKIVGTIEKNRIIIPVEIKIDKFNLSGSADFLIDTGATTSFINESTVRKIGLDYSKLLYVDDPVGIGGKAELYEIEGYTRLTFEFNEQKKIIPKKKFHALKHNFCEHIDPDTQKKVLALEGIFGLDMIKGWRLFIKGKNYQLEIK